MSDPTSMTNELKETLVDDSTKESPDAEAKKETDERDEKTRKRMEINRIRAKEIRKRKKQMEVDMQQQIIKLTLENNQLRSQIKIQEAEIKLLRDSQQTINSNNNASALDYSNLIRMNNSAGLMQAVSNPLSLLQQANLANNPLLNNGGTPGLAILAQLNKINQSNNLAAGLHIPVNRVGAAATSGKSDVTNGVAVRSDLDVALGLNGSLKQNSLSEELGLSNSTSKSATLSSEHEQIAKLLEGSSASMKKSLLDKLQMNASKMT